MRNVLVRIVVPVLATVTGILIVSAIIVIVSACIWSNSKWASSYHLLHTLSVLGFHIEPWEPTFLPILNLNFNQAPMNACSNVVEIQTRVASIQHEEDFASSDVWIMVARQLELNLLLVKMNFPSTSDSQITTDDFLYIISRLLTYQCYYGVTHINLWLRSCLPIHLTSKNHSLDYSNPLMASFSSYGHWSVNEVVWSVVPLKSNYILLLQYSVLGMNNLS